MVDCSEIRASKCNRERYILQMSDGSPAWFAVMRDTKVSYIKRSTRVAPDYIAAVCRVRSASRVTFAGERTVVNARITLAKVAAYHQFGREARPMAPTYDERGSKAKCSDLRQEARNYAKLSNITEEHARRRADGPAAPRTIYTVAPGRCA